MAAHPCITAAKEALVSGWLLPTSPIATDAEPLATPLGFSATIEPTGESGDNGQSNKDVHRRIASNLNCVVSRATHGTAYETGTYIPSPGTVEGNVRKRRGDPFKGTL